jgi:Uma2 family endonuclease
METSLLQPPAHTLPPQPLPYEAFLDWLDEDISAEWVNGWIEPMSPASNQHQDLVAFLGTLLRIHAECDDLGKVLTAPFQMKTGPDLAGREPDLLFVAREHLHRLRPTFLDGPADLVVEIISPESRGRDRGDKFYEYEQGGVREYWLLDPIRNRAEFYTRTAEGFYEPMPLTETVFESQVLPGFRLPTAWLWQEPLPRLRDALDALGLR